MFLSRKYFRLHRKQSKFSSRFNRPSIETLEDRVVPSTPDPWTGGAKTLNWSDAGNWGSGVPTQNNDVTIPSATGTITISGGAFSVGSLNNSGAALEIQSTGGLTIVNDGNQSIVSQNVTVDVGGSLEIGAGASLYINDDVAITVNGNLKIDQNAQLGTQDDNFDSPHGIIVNGDGQGDGTMTVTDAAFTKSGGNNSNTGNAVIQINANAEITATGSTFAWDQIELTPNSVFKSGDLTDNTFNQSISLLPTKVPELGSNNVSFEDIDLLADALNTGSLTLSPLGTAPVMGTSQRYVFTADFTVQVGATLTFDTNSVVFINDNQTLTINGTLDVNDNAQVGTQDNNFDGPHGIVVNGDGQGDGTMSVTDAAFIKSGGNNSNTGNALIQINANAEFKASNSTFGWDQVNLVAGSVYNSGDWSGNKFNQPISVPVPDVPLIANNVIFQQVQLLSYDLPSGSLTLSPLGSNSMATQSYVLTGACIHQR
jgi:hypothetical protein